MRVLVAHNYHLSLDPHQAVEMKPYPPLGTLVIAQQLRQAGHQVSFYDSTFAAGTEAFRTMVRRQRPARVVLAADHHQFLQKMCLLAQRRAAAQMIRDACASGAEVIVSGPDATDEPQAYLAAGATVVIRGEPDGPIGLWMQGQAPETLPGAVVIPDGPTPGAAPPMRDLAGLPPPAWDLVDLDAYADRWRARHGYWEAMLSSVRGCPYRCNWCAKPVWGRRASTRPGVEVVAEMAELVELGADRVWFSDDIFALKRAWLREFREALDHRKLRLPYRCLSRVDLMVRDGFVEDLAGSGCVEVWVGAESGSQRILDAMDKDCTVEQIYEAGRRLREAGVKMGFFLQLGYPGERLEDVQRTIRMIRDVLPDEVGVSVSLPLPGTVFYERVREELTATHWESAMDNTVLFQGEYVQPFYDAAREVIRREHAFLHGVSAAKRLVLGRSCAKRADLRRVAMTAVHGPQIPVHHLRMRLAARRPTR